MNRIKQTDKTNKNQKNESKAPNEIKLYHKINDIIRYSSHGDKDQTTPIPANIR